MRTGILSYALWVLYFRQRSSVSFIFRTYLVPMVIRYYSRLLPKANGAFNADFISFLLIFFYGLRQMDGTGFLNRYVLNLIDIHFNFYATSLPNVNKLNKNWKNGFCFKNSGTIIDFCVQHSFPAAISKEVVGWGRGGGRRRKNRIILK